jgi:large subunit ribosomal protein L15
MKLEDLRPATGSKKNPKRKGRGNSSGNGTTAGRGGKGQTARSGGFHKKGFEGGQMPIQRRLPKFGFNNIFRVEYTHINLSTINSLSNEKELNPEQFLANGIIKKSQSNRIKILAKGNIDKPYIIKAHKFSKSAIQKIEALGGKVEVLV